MPVYDTVNTVLNAVRTRANDAIASLAGDVLTNAQPFMQVYTNNGWRRFQEFLANLGYTRLNREIVVSAIPPKVGTDPALQCWLGWQGFFDGTALHPSISLPQDLIFPISIWERINGQNIPFLGKMENMVDGLRLWAPNAPLYQYQWTWREDKIFVPGSLSTEDWRIQYAAYFPDFNTLSNVAITAASKANPTILTSAGSGVIDGETVTISGATGAGWTNLNAAFTATVLDENTFSVPLDTSAYAGTVGGSPVFATASWFSRPVPVMRALDPLSLFILYEATAPRGDVDRNEILTMAENSARLIMNRDIRQKERVNIRRMSRSGRLEGYSGSVGAGGGL